MRLDAGSWLQGLLQMALAFRLTKGPPQMALTSMRQATVLYIVTGLARLA